MAGVPPGGQALRFEILGPLRVRRGDREIDLGPAKQRAVLGVLVLSANRPVGPRQIIDTVWGDEPPANGGNVVQKYVAGLRRALEPDRSPRAPGRLLTLSEAGYRLAVDPGCLDADVFRQLVRRGRLVLDEGRPTDAAGQLRAALALWRGEALAGLVAPAFDAARDRLTEERAAALELWAQAELGLGHHEQLVPELVRLVAEFPQRERLRQALMLGLYRCGRQADALTAFRDARHYLVEEFGVEPGEEMRRLHAAILRSDPALAAPEPANRSVLPASDGAHPVRADDPPPYPREGSADPAQSVDSDPVDPGWVPVVPVAPTASEAPVARADASGSRWSRGWQRVRSGWRFQARRLLAVGVVTFSFGILTWAVVAYFAIRRQSASLAMAAAGYLGTLVVMAIMVDTGWGDNFAVGCWLVAYSGASAHAAVLTSK